MDMLDSVYGWSLCQRLGVTYDTPYNVLVTAAIQLTDRHTQPTHIPTLTGSHTHTHTHWPTYACTHPHTVTAPPHTHTHTLTAPPPHTPHRDARTYKHTQSARRRSTNQEIRQKRLSWPSPTCPWSLRPQGEEWRHWNLPGHHRQPPVWPPE